MNLLLINMLNSPVNGKTPFGCFFTKSLLLLVLLFFGHALPVRAQDNLEPILQLILEADDPSFHRDLLKGMRDGLAGRRNLSAPPSWKLVFAKLAKSSDAVVREEIRLLGLIFGDAEALRALRSTVMNAKASEAERRRALAVLVEKKSEGLSNDLKLLLDDDVLRIDALRGMAVFGGAEVPQLVLARYGKLKESEKREAVQLLVSRPVYAKVLLDALAKGVVKRAEISVFAARQIFRFGDKELNARLKELWGEIRPTAKNKTPLFSKYRKLLTPKNLKKADLPNGRLVYTRTCASCHKLFGEGRQVGPDLTGSDRANLEYMLENVLDPNAAIAKDFQLNVVRTKNGRAVSGIIVAENHAGLTVQTITERILLSKQDVAVRRTLDVSMMPEGIFQALADMEVRNLVAYLATTKQVPLPKTGK